MKLSIASVAAFVVMGALILMAAASADPLPASAINLHDDAATIAAADAAKFEVLRRQQEEARIAQMTRQAIAEATRQEQSRIAEATRQEQVRVAQETRMARDMQATESARHVQATATEQAVISRTLALSGTAAALEMVKAQATQTAQAVEAEHVAEVQAAEATRMVNEAYQWRATLQQVGVVLLFAFGFALFIATMRGLWTLRIGGRARSDQPEAEANAAATAPQPDAQTPKEPEVLIVDDVQFAETLAEMWKSQEPVQ